MKSCETLKQLKQLPCLPHMTASLQCDEGAPLAAHFWLPWLPLASSLAVPDCTIVAIRYQDAGWMWKLVRQSSEWSTIHHPLFRWWGAIPLLQYWICRFLPLPPKLTVRIVMPFRGESISGLDSQLKTEDSRLKTQKSKLTGCPQKALRRYRRKSQRVSRLLCWLLAADSESCVYLRQGQTFCVIGQFTTAESHGLAVNYSGCPQETFTPLWEEANPSFLHQAPAAMQARQRLL